MIILYFLQIVHHNNNIIYIILDWNDFALLCSVSIFGCVIGLVITQISVNSTTNSLLAVVGCEQVPFSPFIDYSVTMDH